MRPAASSPATWILAAVCAVAAALPATGPEETVAVAWDGYASGSYDLYFRMRQHGRWTEIERPAAARYHYSFVDQPSGRPESYLYLRVIQRSGDIAWGSPVWVTYTTASGAQR
jgi:hypothetical protein